MDLRRPLCTTLQYLLPSDDALHGTLTVMPHAERQRCTALNGLVLSDSLAGHLFAEIVERHAHSAEALFHKCS